jgi:hypothetical protein
VVVSQVEIGALCPARINARRILKMTDRNNVTQDILISQSQHIVLIGFLLEHAKAQDPEFSMKAAERLDYVLGRYFIGEGCRSTEVIAELRTKILAQLNDPSKLMSRIETKRLTLRRRFLNWLQSD